MASNLFEIADEGVWDVQLAELQHLELNPLRDEIPAALIEVPGLGRPAAADISLALCPLLHREGDQIS